MLLITKKQSSFPRAPAKSSLAGTTPLGGLLSYLQEQSGLYRRRSYASHNVWNPAYCHDVAAK